MLTYLTQASGELLILGLSSDSKPSNPANNSIFFEIDTGKIFNAVSNAWVVQPLTAKAISTRSVAAPTQTSSTTGVMMGLAASITPTVSGRVKIVVTGNIRNSILASGANVQLRYGTGSAPANAAALTGTVLGSLNKFTAPVAAVKIPFALCFIVTGLTVGTAYWVDVGLAAVTSGNASIADVDISCTEL